MIVFQHSEKSQRFGGLIHDLIGRSIEYEGEGHVQGEKNLIEAARAIEEFTSIEGTFWDEIASAVAMAAFEMIALQASREIAEQGRVESGTESFTR